MIAAMQGAALGGGLNLALGAAKQILNNSALVDVAAGLAEEASATQQLLGSPNQLEAITAHFEGRTPNFQDAKGT